MDATSDTTDKPKLEDMSHSQLMVLLKEAMERIKSLEKKLNDTLPTKLPVPYSVRSAGRKLFHEAFERNRPHSECSFGPGRIVSKHRQTDSRTTGCDVRIDPIAQPKEPKLK